MPVKTKAHVFDKPNFRPTSSIDIRHVVSVLTSCWLAIRCATVASQFVLIVDWVKLLSSCRLSVCLYVSLCFRRSFRCWKKQQVLAAAQAWAVVVLPCWISPLAWVQLTTTPAAESMLTGAVRYLTTEWSCSLFCSLCFDCFVCEI